MMISEMLARDEERRQQEDQALMETRRLEMIEQSIMERSVCSDKSGGSGCSTRSQSVIKAAEESRNGSRARHPTYRRGKT